MFRVDDATNSAYEVKDIQLFNHAVEPLRLAHFRLRLFGLASLAQPSPQLSPPQEPRGFCFRTIDAVIAAAKKMMKAFIEGQEYDGNPTDWDAIF